MKKHLFVMLMESKKPLDIGVIQRHVQHLKELDEIGQLVLCGPLGENGGGMVILNTASYAEADAICLADPFIAEGYKSYVLKTLEVADKSNGYLLG